VPVAARPPTHQRLATKEARLLVARCVVAVAVVGVHGVLNHEEVDEAVAGRRVPQEHVDSLIRGRALASGCTIAENAKAEIVRESQRRGKHGRWNAPVEEAGGRGRRRVAFL